MHNHESFETSTLEDILEQISFESTLEDLKRAENELSDVDPNYKESSDFISRYNKVADELAEREQYVSLMELFSVFKVVFETSSTQDAISHITVELYEDSLNNAISNSSSESVMNEVKNTAKILVLLGGIPENIIEITKNILDEKNASESISKKILTSVSSEL